MATESAVLGFEPCLGDHRAPDEGLGVRLSFDGVDQRVDDLVREYQPKAELQGDSFTSSR